MGKKDKQPATFIGLSNRLIMIIVIFATALESMGGATLFIKCLYSFFMPLMFLNAGIIIHRNVVSGSDSWREFIRGLFRTFIITYFLWALIYSIFSYKNLLWIVYGSKEALIYAGTLDILWFLPCMFIARLLNEIVFHIVDALPLDNKKIGCGVFIIIFFAIGVLLPKLPVYGYPWCLNAGFIASGFMLLGYLLRDAFEIVAKKPIIVIAGLIVSIAVFLFGTVFRADSLVLMHMETSDFGNILWFFINALSGSMMLLFAAMLLTRCWKRDGAVIRPEDETGYNKTILGTFVIHRPLLQQVVTPLLMLMLPIQLPKFVLVLTGFIITKIISGWIIKMLAKTIPQLFGIYYAETNSVKEA